MTVTFANRRAHAATSAGGLPVTVSVVGEPQANLTLFGSSSAFIPGVLVDTGADFLMLPGTFATLAGLSLAAGHPVLIVTGAGSTSMTLLTGIRVMVEGVSIVTEVLFNPHPSSPAVLGRNALFAALGTVGFDATDWHW